MLSVQQAARKIVCDCSLDIGGINAKVTGFPVHTNGSPPHTVFQQRHPFVGGVALRATCNSIHRVLLPRDRTEIAWSVIALVAIDVVNNFRQITVVQGKGDAMQLDGCSVNARIRVLG